MTFKMFKLKDKFRNKEHQTDPDFYWRVVFGCTLVLVIAAFVFGINLFLKISKDDVSAVAQYNSEGQKINKTRIDKVLQFFADRKKESENILFTPSPQGDPSI